jgi:hypothetical protein
VRRAHLHCKQGCAARALARDDGAVEAKPAAAASRASPAAQEHAPWLSGEGAHTSTVVQRPAHVATAIATVPAHRFAPMLGPAEDYPTGTIEWAERMSNRLQLGVRSLSRSASYPLRETIEAIADARPCET